MALVQLACPLCGGVFQVDEAHAGLQVACPHCQGAVIIPQWSSAPPPNYGDFGPPPPGPAAPETPWQQISAPSDAWPAAEPAWQPPPDYSDLPTGSLPEGSLPPGPPAYEAPPSNDWSPAGWPPEPPAQSGWPTENLPHGGLPEGALPPGGWPAENLPHGGLPQGMLPTGNLPQSTPLPQGALPQGALAREAATPPAKTPRPAGPRPARPTVPEPTAAPAAVAPEVKSPKPARTNKSRQALDKLRSEAGPLKPLSESTSPSTETRRPTKPSLIAPLAPAARESPAARVNDVPRPTAPPEPSSTPDAPGATTSRASEAPSMTVTKSRPEAPSPAARPEVPPSRKTAKADALLPPPAMAYGNGAARPVYLPLAPVPLPELDNRRLPADPAEARFELPLDPETAALTKLRDPVRKVIIVNGEEIELRKLTPEERAARRLLYNAVLIGISAMILGTAMLIALFII